MSALNTVVNNLIRAAAAIPSHISDVDLDRHVAKLLADEAKAKEQSWKELGLGAYLSKSSPDPNAPKANKRFLASVIRQVDGHNAAVIRAQNQSALQAREERRGESSRSGASRLFGGAMKGLQSNGPTRRNDRSGRERDGRRDEGRGGWDDDGRQGERRDRDRDGRRRFSREDGAENRSRRDTYYSDEEARDHRSSRSHREYRDDRSEEPRHSERSRGSRDNDRIRTSDHRRSRPDEEDDERRRRRRDSERDDDDRARGSHRTRHRSRSAEKPHRDRSPSAERRDRSKETDKDRGGEKRSKSYADRTHDSDGLANENKPRRSNNKHHDETIKASVTKERSRAPSPPPPPPPDDSPPPSPGPLPPPPKISRMDRYFKEDYDPRLDLGEVPKQGPVVEVGWDNMLAILKDRGQKRRVKSPGLFDDEPPTRAKIRDDHAQLEIDLRWEKAEKEAKKRKKEERRKKRGDDDASESEGERKRRKEAEEKVVLKGEEGLFDMSYVKKGGTREWDKGK